MLERRSLRWPVIAFFFLGTALVNEWLVADVLTSDGALEPATVWSVRSLQAALAVCGLSVLLRRASLASGLIIAACVLNLSTLEHKVESAVAGRTIAEERLVPLRTLLPAVERVGYATDELPWTSNRATERYYVTQYALAPVVVVLDQTQEWVVGNYKDPTLASVPRGMSIVRDFGNGLMLFRRNTP